MLIPSVAVPISFWDIIDVFKLLYHNSLEQLSEQFKQNCKNRLGVKEIVTFQSGMLAMIQILRSLVNNNKAKEVILPVYTCPTILLAVEKAKLIPKFVDIDESTFCISMDEVIKNITPNTLAIIIPHMFGYIVDVEKILAYRTKYSLNFYIIEDFCQAIISDHNMVKTRLYWGDFGIFSFGRAKCISTVNGGAIVTYQKENVNQLKVIERNQDVTCGYIKNCKYLIKFIMFALAVLPTFYGFIDKLLSAKRSKDKFNLKTYEHLDFLSNNPLNKVQFAIGNVMLNKLPMMAAKRKINASFYNQYFLNTEVKIQPNLNNFYLRYAVIFINEDVKVNFLYILKQKKIKISTGDYPVLSTISGIEAFTIDPNFPIATRIASNILVLPTHPGVIISQLYL